MSHLFWKCRVIVLVLIFARFRYFVIAVFAFRSFLSLSLYKEIFLSLVLLPFKTLPSTPLACLLHHASIETSDFHFFCFSQRLSPHHYTHTNRYPQISFNACNEMQLVLVVVIINILKSARRYSLANSLICIIDTPATTLQYMHTHQDYTYIHSMALCFTFPTKQHKRILSPHCNYSLVILLQLYSFFNLCYCCWCWCCWCSLRSQNMQLTENIRFALLLQTR